MTWRRLRPGEIDHEALWLAASLGALAWAWFWLHSGLSLPQCPWHRLLGWPCPTCGATRCLRYAFHGAWKAAFLVNPLVLVSFVGIALYDGYAALVLGARLPRLRWERVTPETARKWRVGVIAVIALNWVWLIRSGV